MRTEVLVTGPTAGIGEAFARRLAADGHDLVLVSRSEARLQALARELSHRHGVAAEALAADLAEPEGLRRVEERIERSDRLELLVNNAGFGLGGDFDRVPADDAERMMRVHTIAPVRLVRAALPGMKARGRGAIINVSSVAAWWPLPGTALYAATKAFLNSFTEGLHADLAGTGVRVQALCPGFTHTEFHQRAGMDKSTIPGFLWMTADQVVDASLRALDSGQVVCVPGALNQALVAVAESVPNGLRRWLNRDVGGKLGR